jgi:hypothetical protein
MVDIETLGTTVGSKLVSIGACVFSPEGIGDSFYSAIDIDTSPGTIDTGTLKWWFRQSEAARSVFWDAHAGVHQTTIAVFLHWWESIHGTNIWADPDHFDIPILNASITAGGFKYPWTHRDVRDARTVRKIAGVEIEHVGTAHNALDDAISQAKATITALNKIGWPILG